jgi:hypothetical protein
VKQIAWEEETVIDPQDVARLERAIDSLRHNSTVDVLRLLSGGRQQPTRDDAIVRACDFVHVGVLVFPDVVEDVTRYLRSHGLVTREPIPSVVVKQRIARRTGVSPESLPVTIVTAALRTDAGAKREIEVFILPGLPGRELPDSLAAHERRDEQETHYGFEVREPGGHGLALLLDEAADRYGMFPDGGGYNPYERPEANGRSVFYFDGAVATGVHRLEFACAGHHRDALDRHTRRAAQRKDAEQSRLLELIAGYWGARAVHTAAAIGLAEALADGPRNIVQTAAATGCDPDALGRLLRYLAGIGLVAEGPERTYSTTATLDLLRADSPFNDLTMLYGGEFYQAWSRFEHSLRTGETAFSREFGREHFDYLKTRPELGLRFDRAMAATTTAVAERVGTTYDFSGASRIVDIGGGNGTLLAAVLRANPHATGVLVEQAHVLDKMHEWAYWPGERAMAVAADFFSEVPDGGDVYILSRVLHDWADEDCRSIMRVCRKAMPTGAQLVVIERVLPDEPAPSLAGLWDLQMLAITGGRERTLSEIRQLLADTGFAYQGSYPLCLGMSLLVADAV